MRKEFVYSFLALGAIPVTVNATEAKSFDNIICPAGSQINQEIGTLAPGKYTLKGDLISKLYKVTIEIGGAKKTFESSKTLGVDENEPQKVAVDFELKKASKVTLKMYSESTVSGSEFTFGSPLVDLTFDFAAAKTTLEGNVDKVITTIEGYTYAAKEDDVKAAKALKTAIGKIGETYKDYEDNGLYDLEKGAMAMKIKKVASDAAYNQIDMEISDAKTAYNTAVLTLKEELVEASQYLQEGALKKLESDIDAKITEAIVANGASKKAVTADNDIATNRALIPTQAQIDAIVNDYKAQSTKNKNAAKALQDEVSGLQKRFDAVKTTGIDKEKKAASDAIAALKAIVDPAINTKNQLDLATKDNYKKALSDAKKAVTAYENQGTNTDNYNANVAALDKLQEALNKAKSEAKTSKDGKYKVGGDYNKNYLKAIQDYVDNQKKANEEAKKAGTASKIAEADLKAQEDKIKNFSEKHAKAVEKYDDLQKAMADEKAQLENARSKVDQLGVYTAGGYDYKMKLDEILKKDINGIQDQIDDANKLEGEAHWTAIMAIDAKNKVFTKSFAAVSEIGESSFSIYNENEDKAICFGLGAEQDMNYAALGEALASKAFSFKLEKAEGAGLDKYFYLRVYKPNGEVNNVWGWGGYFNSQPANGNVCFCLSKNANGHTNGTDMDNGAVWDLIPDGQGKFLIKNIGTGKYLKDAAPAKYEEKDAAHFNLSTADASSVPAKILDLVTKANQAEQEYAGIVCDKAITELNSDLDNDTKNLKDICGTINEEAQSQDKTDPAGYKVYGSTAEGDPFGDFATDKAAIAKAISDLQTKIKDMKAEDKVKWYRAADGLDAEKAKIQKMIDDLLAKAKAASDNYQAYLSVSKEWLNPVYTGEKEAQLAKAITSAEGKITKELTGEGALKYYQDLLAGYKKQKEEKATDKTAGGIDARWEKSLKDGKAVKAKDEFVAEIKDLKAKVEAIEKDAKENLETYVGKDGKSGEKAKVAETLKLWDETYKKIAAEDESSERDNYLNQLDEMREQLTAIEKEIDDNYAKGKAKSTADDEISKLTQLQKDIAELKAKQEEGYNAQIEADNKATKANIDDAIKAAQEAYSHAIVTMQKYENVVSTDFAAAVKEAENQADVLNDVLYGNNGDKKSFIEKLNPLKEKINKAYVGTTSPAVFDKDDALLKEVEALTKEVTDAETAYTDAIRAKAAEVSEKMTNEKGTGTYDMAYNNALTTIKGYVDGKDDKEKTANAKPYLAEVAKLTAEIRDALKDPDLTKLDNAFAAAKDAESGVQAKIDEALNKAAYDNLDKQLKAVEKVKDNLLDYEQEQLADARAAVEEAKANGDCHNNYGILQPDIAVLKASADKAQAVDDAFAEFTKVYDDVNAKLEAAIEVANKFAVAGTVTGNDKEGAFRQLGYIKQQLENNKDDADGYKDWVVGNKDFRKNQIDNYKNTIASLPTEIHKTLGEYLFDKEVAQLESYINDLEAQYVLFTNDFDDASVPEKAKAYKNQIELFKTKYLPTFGAIAADKKKVVLDDKTKEIKTIPAQDSKFEVKIDDKTKDNLALLELQNKMTELLTEMCNANNPAANTNAAQLLTDKLENAKENLELDGYDVDKYEDWQQEYVAETQAKINAKIANVEKQIEAKKDNIIPFADDLNKQIDAINEDIKNLKATADWYQENLEKKIAAKAGFASDANDKLDAIQQAIDDAKAEIDGYEYASADDYKAKFDLAQDNLDDAKEIINGLVESGNIEQSDVDDIDYVANDVDDILADVKNTAANREMKGILNDLKEQLKAINPNEDDYTMGDWKKIQDAKKAILDNETDPKNPTGMLVDIENAIKASAQGLTSYADYTATSYVGDDPETGDPIYEPSGIQKQIADAQEAIDKLKDMIEENTLNPVEPELIPGDITGSGDVDMDDVDQFIDDFMNDNLPEPGDPLFDVYDVNQDGELDIADAQAIFNLYMGLNIDGTQPNAARMLSNFKNLDMAGNVTTDVTEIGNGIKRIAVMLNANFEYTGFQVDVMGADVIDQQADGMSVRSNKMLSGTTRILGFNFSQAKAAGKVLVIDVKGDAEITDVTFTTSGARSISFNLGDATRLNGVNAGENGTTIYDLSGKVKNGLKKGVNIIRDAYGKAKKALK